MPQPRVFVCLFSPLGAALVLGPADPPESRGTLSSPGRSPWRPPWREPAHDEERAGAGREPPLPDRNVAPSGS
jgi:hypothetical protein